MTEFKQNEPSIFTNNRHFILSVLSLKYVYFSCIIVFLAIATIINRYSPRIYEVNASISPVQKQTSSILSSNDLFRGLEAYQSNSNIENEINNLISFSRVLSTISSMNLEIGYFYERNQIFREVTDLYKVSPFSVNMDRSHVQSIGNRFYISMVSDSTFRLTTSSDEVMLYNYVDNQIIRKDASLHIDTLCKFNQTISNPYFKFSVASNKRFLIQQEERDKIYFEFYHLDFLAKSYYSNLLASRVSPMSSILTIQFSGQNIDKVIAFLNTYLNAYSDESLANKNKIAISTIKFIDNQLSEMSDSLVLSESKLKNFRSANQVMDLSFQGQQLYESLQQIDAEKSSLLVQERYYNYVLDYFNKNRDISGVVPPSAMNVVDPIMNQLITELLALNSERSNLLANNSEKNLFLEKIENKIAVQKQQIIENVTNNLNTLSLSLNELNYRSEKASKEISALPKTELNMVGMQRTFNLNNQIYTFLLQKRSEAAIAMASNYPDYEILESAREITSRIVAPKKKVNYVIALILAIAIPTSILILKDLLNNKIIHVATIENLIDKPTIGTIHTNDLGEEAVVTEFPNSSMAEAFRNIRSSLFYKLKSQESKIILITSSQPRDGKSFVSFNLAYSIASVGYKTVIIDNDLHRPTLHHKFNEENNIGLSTYLMKESKLNDIIHKTHLDNLSFIPAGPILPNPSELVESGALDDLVNELKKEYEYILIDSAPIGIVADSLMLLQYASHILLVCRNNYTRKDVFSNAIERLKSYQILNFDVILNDQSLNESPYRKYTSYYKKDRSS
jgi:capsular exopolysaccharide synthesis family protein